MGLARFPRVLLPRRNTCGLGSAAFARHYLRHRFLFLFLRLLRCFTSAGLASVTLCVQVTSIALLAIRLPHSDTPGSSLACNSPRLFAACCVLLRRTTPRHPPQALPSLTPSRRGLPLPSLARSLSPQCIASHVKNFPFSKKAPYAPRRHFLSFLEIVSFPLRKSHACSRTPSSCASPRVCQPPRVAVSS